MRPYHCQRRAVQKSLRAKPRNPQSSTRAVCGWPSCTCIVRPAMAILTVPESGDLDALLAAYDLGERRAAKGIEAGTVNTSYVLEMGTGRFFLRLYEEQPKAGAEAEARLLLHLAASGVPTPSPVKARDGS